MRYGCSIERFLGGIFAVICLVVPAQFALSFEVTPRLVYSYDANMPLGLVDANVPHIYEPVMVGTRLTVILSRDSNVPDMPDHWNYGWSLALTDENMDRGQLAGRDFNEVTYDYEGSTTPFAGELALVRDWLETGTSGFDMYYGDFAVPGDWFIIDYEPTAPGPCLVGYYDQKIDPYVPLYYLEFEHVPSRDFDGNYLVDFADFASFSDCWSFFPDPPPAECTECDLNESGYLDQEDLWLFTEYWLGRL
jgi:hypothetical protein